MERFPLLIVLAQVAVSHAGALSGSEPCADSAPKRQPSADACSEWPAHAGPARRCVAPSTRVEGLSFGSVELGLSPEGCSSTRVE